MKKSNCWEIKKCGRGPGGTRCEELGVCPAASDASSDGINGGTNGGRYCWAVAGTLCSSKSKGSFVDKQASCVLCEFFRMVKAEEDDFTMLKK